MHTDAPTIRAVIAYVHRKVTTGVITPGTGYDQRQILLGFAASMGQRPVNKIGRSDIERWMGTLTHLSPGTRRNRFAVVRGFFDDLVDRDIIRRSPVRPIPTPKVPRAPHRALTAEQCAAIIAHADAAMKVCILLALQCCLRRGEVAGIELGDIDWTTMEVTVIGKGRHKRTVSIPTEAAQAIRDYLATRHKATAGPLVRLPRHPEHGVTGHWIGEQFAAIATQAGVKQSRGDGITFHALRHTGATDIYRESGDVVMVRDVLGHMNLATTETYVAGRDRNAMKAAMDGRTYQREVA